jgi:hypothetical protein
MVLALFQRGRQTDRPRHAAALFIVSGIGPHVLFKALSDRCAVDDPAREVAGRQGYPDPNPLMMAFRAMCHCSICRSSSWASLGSCRFSIIC